jgi:hypothetical protein
MAAPHPAPTAAVYGIDACLVEIEVDVDPAICWIFPFRD